MIRIFIAALALLFMALPGLGFAQDVGLGMPSPGDQSVILLSYVFGVVNGVLHGTGSQIMGQMFAKFNSAMLVLCGIVVIYTTFMGILNTAQEGEFLGKKYSSFFVPMRTALGILLIAPTSTGYSWIQVIVIWIVLQSVSAANMVWSAAIDYILNGGVIIVQNQSMDEGSSLVAQQARTLVTSLTPAVTCLQMTQRAIDETVYSSSGAIHPPTQSALQSVTSNMTDSTAVITMPNFSGDTDADKSWQFLNGLCGTLTNSQATTTSTAKTQAQVIALKQVMLDLAGATPAFTSSCKASCYDDNQKAIDCPSGTMIPNDAAPCVQDSDCYPNGLVASPPNINPYSINTKLTPVLSWCNDSDPTKAINWDAYSNLHNTFNIATMDYLGLTYNSANRTDPNAPSYQIDTTTLNDAKNAGWIGAGAYYFALLQANAGAQFGQSTGVPFHVTSGTLTFNKNDLDKRFQQTSSLISANEDRFKTWLLPFFSDQTAPNNGLINNFSSAANQISGAVNYGHRTPFNLSDQVQGHAACGAGSFVCGVLEVFLPGLNTMLNAFQELLNAQQNNTNPVVAMMLFGSGMMSTALMIWLGVMSFLTVAAIAAGFIPSVDVSNGFTTAAVIFAPLMTAILVPMFVTGTMLLFYLPMVPFMIFTFGGIGWIVGVIEAMIAGPVVAFGIMHPEGGSDLFGKGEQAIMYILNLFLRPPLMIFGLIAGIMISYVGIWMINDGWNLVTPVIYAVEGYDWSSQIAGFIVGLIALPMIYLVMVMQIINRSFAMIHLFPDRITRWLSGGIQESLGSEFSGMEKDARQGVEKGVGHIGDTGKGAASGMGGGARARHKHKLQQDERKKKEGSGGVQAS